jgi:hypothetical protein
MDIDIDQLNTLAHLQRQLNESIMNVTWNGMPADLYIQQLIKDCENLKGFLTSLSDRCADDLKVKWNSDLESYV